MIEKIEDNANVNFNPLKAFVILLIFSYILGVAFEINLSFPAFVNFIGLLFLLKSVFIFIISIRIFFAHKEKLPPSTSTNKIIKTGIYSYTRNPIYLAFVFFQIGMFLVFVNIYYFFSSLVLIIWLNFHVIKAEERYLEKKFNDEYLRYKNNVPRWLL